MASSDSLGSMALQLVSDLHVDVAGALPAFAVHADTLCIAGDIAAADDDGYTNTLRKASEAHARVLVIPGNHEFYGGSHDSASKDMLEAVADLSNVSLLHNGSVEIRGRRIIGSVLWTVPNARLRRHVSDHKQIVDYSSKGCDWAAADAAYVREQVDQCAVAGHRAIVLSHFPPLQCSGDVARFGAVTPRTAHEGWYARRHHDLQEYFYHGDMDATVAKVHTWMYGHTHAGSRDVHSGCVLVSNPMGYPYEARVSGYSPSCVVHV